MDFGEVLAKAWDTIWKHKVLWIFGILAGCGSQAGSSGGQGVNYRIDPGDFDILPSGTRHFFFQVERWFNEIPEETFIAVVVGLVLLGILIGLLIYVLSVFGHVGVVKGTLQVDRGAEKLTFGQLSKDALPFMWRALGLNLLAFVVVFLVALVLGAILFGVSIATLGLGVCLLLPGVCLLIPLAAVVGVYLEQANVALVVEDCGIFEAFKHGWRVLSENLANMVIMALILIIGAGLVNFLIGLPLLALLLPVLAALFGGVSLSSQTLFTGGLVVGLVGFLLYLPVMLLLSGVLQAYVKSAWTLTYMRLSKPAIASVSDAGKAVT